MFKSAKEIIMLLHSINTQLTCIQAIMLKSLGASEQEAYRAVNHFLPYGLSHERLQVGEEASPSLDGNPETERLPRQ